MIQFRSEGIILDVQPDQDVTFTLDNPIFEDDRVPVAVSTNVEFKLSPKNCKFFGFTPGIRRRPSRKTAACEALFNGIVAFQGELKYDATPISPYNTHSSGLNSTTSSQES